MVATRMEPRRLRLERDSMHASQATLVRLPDGELCWCDVLTSNRGNEYDILIRYPQGFPYERPIAVIVTPEIHPGAPHRYADKHGTLCLFPSPIDMTFSCTAGAVRARVALWILYYENWLETGVWDGPELAH
jgi:hypothetical protein